jgi:hypothetical protein
MDSTLCLACSLAAMYHSMPQQQVVSDSAMCGLCDGQQSGCLSTVLAATVRMQSSDAEILCSQVIL